MTEEDHRQIAPVIAKAQRLETKLHGELIARGVAPIDVLIAATYSAHELGTRLHGEPVAAIEWMRDALDTIERQILAQGKPN